MIATISKLSPPKHRLTRTHGTSSKTRAACVTIDSFVTGFVHMRGLMCISGCASLRLFLVEGGVHETPRLSTHMHMR